MSASRSDVIIVGAGVSGLSAARRLLLTRPDLEVTVLEAKHRVGGRVLSKDVGCSDGQRRSWSFGAEWVSDKQLNVSKLLEELAIATFPQFKDGKKCVELESAVTQYDGGVPAIGLLNLLDSDSTLKSLQRQAASAFGGNAEHLKRLTQESARDAIERLSMRRDSEVFLRGILRALLQAEDSSVCCLRALQVAGSGGGFERLLKESQQLRIVGGAQAMVESLADSVGHERLRLGTRVTRVTETDGCVQVTTSEGDVLECQRLLLTLPLASLRDVSFEPPLPPQLSSLIDSCPAASRAVKIVVTYRRAFWRDAGLSGEILSCQGSPTSRGGARGPVCLCYDATSADGEHPALTIVAVAADGESPADRQASVLEHLARFFASEDVNNFVDFVEHDWSHEPFHATCLATAVPPGDAAASLATCAKPHGHVRFAGSDFAVSWIGFLEGAVQSGQDAADQILDGLD